MSLIFQEIVILAMVIMLAIFSAFRTKGWFIDETVINIKVVKPGIKKLISDKPQN
jgi:hypothetical protein